MAVNHGEVVEQQQVMLDTQHQHRINTVEVADACTHGLISSVFKFIFKLLTFVSTVRPVFFTCPLFCEFRDLGDVAKITGHKYSKSHAILEYYLVQQAKTPKIGAPK